MNRNKSQQNYFKLTAEKLILFFVRKKKRKRLTNIKTKVIQINPGLYLRDIFQSEINYYFVLSLLIDEKLISEETHYWIDFSNGSKKLVVVIIKLLKVKGYYQFHSRLSSQAIHDIALNTFGVDISIEYIRHTNFDDIIVDYIPLASKVKI